MSSPANTVFAIYDGTGAPKTGASPTFTTYVDDTGATLAKPVITEIGGGQYTFVPTFTSGRGIGYIISTGGLVPQNVFGYLRPEDFGPSTPSPQIVVFPIYDAASTPKTGVVPTFSAYTDETGSPLTKPPLTEIGGGLYKFTPVFSAGHDIAYVISTGDDPAYYNGFLRAEDYAASALDLTSVVASNFTVTLTFSAAPDALVGFCSLPSSWTVSPTLEVTAVAVVGNTIVLTTARQVASAAYTFTIPPGVTADAGSVEFGGSYSQPFTGVDDPPAISIIRAVDARTVDIVFVSAPNTVDALDASKYSISPTLTVESVEQLTSTWYRLTTSKQIAQQNYMVTWPT